MTEWQSIDNAPRDGTLIQALDVDGIVFLCRWYTRQEIAEFFDDDDIEAYDSGWYKGDNSDEEEWPVLWRPMIGEAP